MGILQKKNHTNSGEEEVEKANQITELMRNFKESSTFQNSHFQIKKPKFKLEVLNLWSAPVGMLALLGIANQTIVHQTRAHQKASSSRFYNLIFIHYLKGGLLQANKIYSKSSRSATKAQQRKKMVRIL